jgi:hypothetical protein
MQYGQLRDTLDSLHSEMESSDSPPPVDVADLRQRVAWVLTALRHQRAREIRSHL